MNKRLTRRYIIDKLNGLNLSSAIRYERYYINDNLRIQKKNDVYEKEVLDKNNVIITKEKITKDEFDLLKLDSYSEIIRDSYLFLDDTRISIKKYYGIYEDLIRVEVKFESEEEMKSYQKEMWMGEEITDSPLAFDKYLSKLDREQFLVELKSFKQGDNR